MKKILLASAVLATACATSYGQAQRRVLFEGFSQASCGPCAAQNPAFNALVHSPGNEEKTVTIKYQTSWPGTDPMNAQNPTQVATRVTYYGVQGVPDMYMDGNVQAGISPASVTQTMINNEYAVTSPIEVHVTHAWNTTANVDVEVKIKNVSATTFGTADHRLHVALIEKEIHFTTPPGTNGETNFYGVMRKMHPNADGATFTAIPAGDSLVINYTIPVPSYIYGLDQLAVVAFVQNNSNKHVDNAEVSDPKPLPSGVTDVSATNMTTAPTDYCSYTLTPTIEVLNEAPTALQNFRAYYRINGGAQVNQDISGVSIANGQTQVVTFAPITLNPQTASLVQYGITNINQGVGTTDASSLDNGIADELYIALSASAVGTDIAEDFEAASIGSTTITEGFVVNPWDEAGYAVIGVGANGSTKSFKFDFYNIQEGYAELLYDKIDVSAMNQPELSFDHAYAPYNASFFDRMQVNVSTDCGASWTTLFDQEGTVLATTAAVTSAFTPTTAQWRNTILDLSAYASETELVVAFKGLSGYGNNLFVDNINVYDANPQSNVEDIAAINGTVNVFPNPARTTMNIQFELNEMTDMNIVVYNALGQAVRTVANGSFNGLNNLTMDVSDLAAGVYHLNMISNNGVMTQRFVVEK